MKIPIWIGTLFLACLANELIGTAVGFKLGYPLVAVLVASIARTLCKIVDAKKKQE